MSRFYPFFPDPHFLAPPQSGTDWTFIGDLLVFVGLFVTLAVYLGQRASSSELLRQSALAIVTGAREGIDFWGRSHFGESWTGNRAFTRAREDYDRVMNHEYGQIWRVPAEPLFTILQQQDEGRFITGDTIRAVNNALWRIGQYNQIVQQQTDFNAQHAAEITGNEISSDRRAAIAASAERISRHIHSDIIGDASWFSGLLTALDLNISQLNTLGPARWWQLRPRRLPGTMGGAT